MKEVLEKIKNIILAPIRLLKKLIFNIQVKIAGLILGKTLKKQKEKSNSNMQDIDSLKTMVMEFARKSYTGISKDKRLIITLNGQFKVEDVQLDKSLLNEPKELKKAIKQAFGDALGKIMGAMMGLAGGEMPRIPGMPF